MADAAIEYRWHSPVRYGPAALQDFVEFEGIPRALTTSAAIMADAALAIGRKIQNPSLIAESDLIEQFRESFTFTDDSLNASSEDDENEDT